MYLRNGHIVKGGRGFAVARIGQEPEQRPLANQLLRVGSSFVELGWCSAHETIVGDQPGNFFENSASLMPNSSSASMKAMNAGISVQQNRM